jgi:hypothetical protein
MYVDDESLEKYLLFCNQCNLSDTSDEISSILKEQLAMIKTYYEKKCKL